MLFLTLLSASLLLARAIEAPPVQWAQGYTFGTAESHPHAGVETSDGGFLMVGGERVIHRQTQPIYHLSSSLLFSLRGKESGAEWLTFLSPLRAPAFRWHRLPEHYCRAALHIRAEDFRDRQA
jgi:hypothetical protein